MATVSGAHDNVDPKVNPWMPEANPLIQAVLGKLAEELGEAVAIVARCGIQGINECEPMTLKPNLDALQEELADVLAGIGIAADVLGLDPVAITQRVQRKKEHLRDWHGMILQRMAK